jgi:hypothetical protein
MNEVLFVVGIQEAIRQKKSLYVYQRVYPPNE